MADWKGLYTEYFNTVYSNAPLWMRKKGPQTVTKIYDNLFQPVSSEFLPRVEAPRGESGLPISPRTPFRVPITADPQYMSSYVDFGERPKKRAIAYRSEMYSASMIQEDGPEWNPLEFADEWQDQFIQFRNQFLAVNAVRALNRKIEYDNISYLYGKSWALGRFSPGISTARKKTLDAMNGTDFPISGGHTWSDTTNAKPLADLSRIKFFGRELGGTQEINFGLIGNMTKYSLENNENIQKVVQYTQDYTNQTIGAKIAGVDLRYVAGLTYKTVGAGRPSMPIVGDVRETTWDRDNRTRFMTHTDGGSTYEWGLFLPGKVGSTFMARTHPNHKDVNAPYVHSWIDEETEIRKTRMRLAYTPFVDDWSNVMVVKKLALRA